MPAADSDLENDPRLPFQPVKKSHILHCSCHFWYPRYRTLTPKTRLIPLSPNFISYLHADGIQLPPDDDDEDEEFESDLPNTSANRASRNLEDNSDAEDEEGGEEEEPESDPSLQWPDVHSALASTIAELGGKVVPKLNWSAPKDATWINPTNSMECRTPNDVYLLLKSSDFVTHDLEHAFDGCVSDEEEEAISSLDNIHIGDDDDSKPTAHSNMDDTETPQNPLADLLIRDTTKIPYTLSLRKSFALNPSVEFRCFVRRRAMLAISQRSVNYFDFLFPLAPRLRSLIADFFDSHIKNTFPDEDFVFDVYVPDPYNRVWLIDFNPWAPRTDPLLFSWLELLTMDGPGSGQGDEDEDGSRGDEQDSEVDEEVSQPELRLIEKDDPEAYSFNTPQYSAHKMPQDVVAASQSGHGPLREFAEQWKEVLDRGERQS